MAIQFSRAPRVAPGDAITSAQLEGLAEAFNERLRSGLGDGTWRIHHYLINLFAHIRNGDASGFLQPAKAEFFEAYQGLRPDQGEWPVAGAGDPEGANVASPIPAYVFGNEGADLYDESDRLSNPAVGGIPLRLAISTGNSVLDAWYLGQFQRGAFDPDTGSLASPSFDAARSYSVIRYRRDAPYGQSYGGYMPMPEILGTACDDPNLGDDYSAPVNYEIKLTRLSDGDVTTYAGTCKDGPDITPAGKYDSHVYTVVETEWAYYVVLNDGTVDYYDKEQYVEGPYTGAPELRKRQGNHFTHVFNQLVREFRGIIQNGYDEGTARGWNKQAFDFQRFLTTQYMLAPARGVELGDSVALQIPRFIWPHGSVAKSTDATFYQGGTIWSPHASCTPAGFMIHAPGLNGPAVVECYGDGALVATVQLSTESPAAFARMPDHSRYSQVSFRAATEISIPDLEQAYIEALELMTYKPRIHDLFLVMRCFGAR